MKNHIKSLLVAIAFMGLSGCGAHGLSAASHHDNDPRPYDSDRNAMVDVDAALAAAKSSNKRVILSLGGNWCHDSRGLARNLETPPLSTLVQDRYELVYVDVGHRDKNLDVPARFGVQELYGTPTVLILDSDGTLLNRETVHEWRTADSIPFDETYEYFLAFAEQQ